MALSSGTKVGPYEIQSLHRKDGIVESVRGEMAVGVTGVGGPHFSSDGSAYAYVYGQALSQA
jgi:hypothetical protein